MTWFEALTLAVLQGLTEFLPVSSSGHLAVASSLFHSLGEVEDRPDGLFFFVMLHLGTLLAILVFYRRVMWSGARALLSGGGVGETPSRAIVVRSGFLACVATLPAVVVGLTLKRTVDEAFENILVPGFAFLITAALLLSTTRMKAGLKGPAETTWVDALLVGLAQAFAITPGISRSGSTIAAALALGFSRTWAVGFSLLINVPAILGASVLVGKDLRIDSLAPEVIQMTVLATILSGIVGYGAIVWLVRIVRSGRLWYFSVYLVLLSVVVLGTVAMTGRSTESREMTDGQGHRSATLDWPGGVGLVRSGPGTEGAGDDLDRADSPGS
ncbi:undecaprenyl-diphosphate phosphatase [Tautonia rosea]|uniref:undecaprenyl-diphosphate phosphatase n=1 Tax=Tautonia rosea TaxID=2728037 RepID=UPI001F37A35A|nr:undecaprenyl-diphosphate phosphatase [Tautonia rosea]